MHAKRRKIQKVERQNNASFGG